MAQPRTELTRARRWHRRLLRALAGVLVLLALLVGALHTSWAKDKVRQRLEGAIGKRVRGSVSIHALDYDFPFGDVRLDGLEIRDQHDQPAIEVDSMELAVGVWATLTDGPVFESLVVKGLRVRTHVTEDGRNSLRELFIKRTGKKQQRGFAMRSVRVEGLEWEVSKAGGATISLRDGELQARIDKGEFTEVHLDEFAATFVATRGGISVAGALRQKAAHLKTNADLTVLTLQPLTTTLHITRGPEPTQATELKLASAELSLTRSALLARIDQAVLGPLRVGEASARLGFAKGVLAGQQEVQLRDLALDTQTLANLLQLELPLGHARGQIGIAGRPEELIVSGTLETPEGRIEINGQVNATGPDAPTYVLSTTTDVAAGAWPAFERSSLALGSLLPTELRLELTGAGLPMHGGKLDLELHGSRDVGGVATRTLSLRAHRDGHLLHVDSLELDVLGMELDGVGTMDTHDAQELSATFSVSGNARETLARLEALGLRVSPPLQLPSQLELEVALSGTFKERVVVTVLPSRSAIAGGKVRVRGEAVFEPGANGMTLVSADGSMSVHQLQIAALARLARRRSKAQGQVDGTLQLRQRGQTRSISHQLRARLPDQNLELRSNGRLRRGQWRGRISAHALDDERELAWLEGELPLLLGKRVRLRRRGKLQLRGEIPAAALSEHADRLPKPLRQSLAGLATEAVATLTLELDGSAERPRGRLTLASTVTPKTRTGAELGLDMSIAIDGQADGSIILRPSGQLVHAGIDEPLLLLSGDIGTVLNRVRPRESKLSFAVDAALSRRPIAALAPLSSRLAPHLDKLVGDVSAQLQLRGTRTAPRLHAQVAVGADKPLRVDVDARLKGKTLELNAQSSATALPLADLWPGFLPKLADDPLLLNSDLGADAVIDLRRGARISTLSLHGSTSLKGDRVGVPDSARIWRDLRFELKGDDHHVTAFLQAKESDEQEQLRSLELRAQTTLEVNERLSLGHAQARLRTHQWLLFGWELGRPDAPRATLDADLKIAAELSSELPLIDITAETLVYSEPDREVFTHGFVDISPGGDLVFVGDKGRPLGTPGPVLRLGPTYSRVRAIRGTSAPQLERSAKPAKANVASDAQRAKARLRLHIPRPITIVKGPLKLVLRGEVEQLLAPGAGPTGHVEIDSGHLMLFRQAFPFIDARIVLDGGPPRADIFFAEELAPDILRRISRESAGKNVEIHLRPIGGGPLISFSGAGNSTMIDALSLIYTGHGYVLSQPDAPASLTVRAPQGQRPLMIAFVKANIPKLHFLDRFAVWSTPYDAHTSYGQLRYLDASRRLGDGSSRLRLIARPREIGRSRNEAHLDWLFVDSASMSLGAGLRAGSRLGGGVGLFFEWTSHD